MKLILGFFLSILSTLALASPLCQTHEICAIDATCRCTIAADEYQRSFYFDFDNIEKGHLYQCDFASTRGHAGALLDSSTFPVGTIWQLQNINAQFPITIAIDTNSMENSSDKMTIKYAVGSSDMPTEIITSCIRVA